MAAEYIKKINTNEGPKQIDYNALANLPTIPNAVEIDATLTKAGKAADAKAVGDAITTAGTSISKKLDAPTGGTDGQILTKTTDGVAWKDAPAADTVEIDATLATTGKAADAKAVGDALAKKATDAALDVERKRIDNLAKFHEEGGVTSAAEAELKDIRTGADGVTYDSAGAAVRGQLQKKVDAPTADGTEGQVLTKGADGVEWKDAPAADTVEIDATLATTGKAADAKAVGDALKEKVTSAQVTAAITAAIDKSLTVEGDVADAKAVGDALASKVESDDVDAAITAAIDGTLAVAGKAADAKAVGDALNKKTTAAQVTAAITDAIDASLTTTGKAADAKVVGDALKEKVNAEYVTNAVKGKMDAPTVAGTEGQILTAGADGAISWATKSAPYVDEEGILYF